MMATESAADTLAAEVVRRLKSLRNTEDRNRQAILVREVAERLVALREFFEVDGRADYAGQSYGYRQLVSDIWSRAGYADGEERARAQARIRYMVGNVVREQVGAEDLAAAGLQDRSPREQTNDRARARSALALAATSAPIGDTDADLVRAVGAALAILQRLDPGRVAAIAGREQALVVGALRRVQDVAANLIAAAGGAAG